MIRYLSESKELEIMDALEETSRHRDELQYKVQDVARQANELIYKVRNVRFSPSLTGDSKLRSVFALNNRLNELNVNLDGMLDEIESIGELVETMRR